MLQVILGFRSMMKTYADDRNAVLNDLRVIEDSAMRAAALTQQLLAFSRKQIVQPAVLDLVELVRQSEKMLSRVLGEDIALSVDAGGEAGCVMADSAQIQQVIMNLALNARDAMPGGGKIAISIANVSLPEALEQETQAGDYVRLTVSDTGHGMDPGTMSHLFEPFFTTKGLGKGTGLGLSKAGSTPGRRSSSTFRVFQSRPNPAKPAPKRDLCADRPRSSWSKMRPRCGISSARSLKEAATR